MTSLSNFWTRTSTVAVLAPLAAYLILALPSLYFGLVTAGVLMLAAWEWAQLQRRDPRYNLAYCLIIAANLAWVLMGSLATVSVLLGLGVLWWCVGLWLCVNYSQGVERAHKLLRSLSGWLLFVPCAAGLLWLNQRPRVLLAVLGIMWTADIAAYIAGKWLGHHKLVPQLSPGKTWEGLAGAVLGTVGISYLMVALQWVSWSYGFVTLLALSIVGIGLLGDLYESLLKRQAQVKDSGSLLPGHGGVLDRIDSMLAVSPCIAFMLMHMSK